MGVSGRLLRSKAGTRCAVELLLRVIYLEADNGHYARHGGRRPTVFQAKSELSQAKTVGLLLQRRQEAAYPLVTLQVDVCLLGYLLAGGVRAGWLNTLSVRDVPTVWNLQRKGTAIFLQGGQAGQAYVRY